MKRADNRRADEMRELKMERNYISHAEGSVLVQMGKTVIVCTASVEEKVPGWLKDQQKGWVTAEYGMLPRSTHIRLNREKNLDSGRSKEIKRLIGRSLRSVIDIARLGERTIVLDCDVIQADGGTRTAAINGAMIALVDAVKYLRETDKIKEGILKDFVAAISVGLVDSIAMADLAYDEDSIADVDMNLVMTGMGKIVEIQGTAEREPFDRDQLDNLIALGTQSISRIIEFQKNSVKADIPLVFCNDAFLP